MDIAVCLIDSCQDSHLSQDKTLIPVAMNMNISLLLWQSRILMGTIDGTELLKFQGEDDRSQLQIRV